MRVLGISAYYHDSAAALLRDGHVLAAAQEERFTRKKHDSEFPHNAIRSCLEMTGTRPGEIAVVAFYDKPFLKFERLLETYLAFAPKGFTSFRQALPVWVKDKLFQRTTIVKELKKLDAAVDWESKLIFSEHHLSHAASAFYPSPFERAAVLTMDGVGEWTTTSLALGNGRDLKVMREIHFPHSLGLLYSAFTYYTGFKVNSGEYKVMGLAPYGEPKYVSQIKDHLIDIKDDGSFRLNLEYFEYCTGLTMTNGNFDRLFGGPARKPEQKLTQREMDLAASIQAITEEVMLKLALGVAKDTGEKNLCLAGGVALNCVANGKLLRKKYFDRLWLQPAAGDAGGALGAAYVAHFLHSTQGRAVGVGLDAMRGSYLGPQFAQADIEERGTFSFSMPKSFFSSSVIAMRCSLDTSATSSMYGLSESSSNHFATSSASTEGAKGRNDSRYLTFRLSVFCIDGERASPRIERPPSARGPNSMRPWNQPSALPSARAPALFSMISSSVHTSNTAPAAFRRRWISSFGNCGPR